MGQAFSVAVTHIVWNVTAGYNATKQQYLECLGPGLGDIYMRFGLKIIRIFKELFVEIIYENKKKDRYTHNTKTFIQEVMLLALCAAVPLFLAV